MWPHLDCITEVGGWEEIHLLEWSSVYDQASACSPFRGLLDLKQSQQEGFVITFWVSDLLSPTQPCDVPL